MPRKRSAVKKDYRIRRGQALRDGLTLSHVPIAERPARVERWISCSTKQRGDKILEKCKEEIERKGLGQDGGPATTAAAVDSAGGEDAAHADKHGDDAGGEPPAAPEAAGRPGARRRRRRRRRVSGSPGNGFNAAGHGGGHAEAAGQEASIAGGRANGRKAELVPRRGIEVSRVREEARGLSLSIEPQLEKALEWSLEQDREISVLEVERQFGPEAMDDIENMAALNQQLKTVLSHLTEGEAFSIVQNCGRNGLEAYRRLHRRYDPMTGGRKRNLLRAIMSPQRVKLEELGTALETWEDMVSRYDKKNARTGQPELPNDIKCSALEALVPEELEKHLQLNASRLSQYEDMRTEVLMFFETLTGKQLKVNVRNQMPKDGPQPMDVDSLMSLINGKGGGKSQGGAGSGKGNASLKCHNCGKPGHKSADCWSAKRGGDGKPTSGKGQGVGSPAPGKRFEGACNHCGKKGHKVADCWLKNGGKPGGKDKGKGKGRNGKNGRGVRALDDEDQEEKAEPEGEDGGSLDVGGVCCDLGSLDQAVVKKYTADGYLKLNYDTGAATTAFPLEFNLGGTSTGVNMITASGEKIPDMGEIKLATVDENGVHRKIGGKVTQVHKVLASASRINRDGKQNAWLTADGGYLIPTTGPIAVGMEKELKKLMKQHGSETLLPLYVEKGVYNFYLKIKDGEPVQALDVAGVGSPAQQGKQQSGVGSPAQTVFSRQVPAAAAAVAAQRRQ